MSNIKEVSKVKVPFSSMKCEEKEVLFKIDRLMNSALVPPEAKEELLQLLRTYEFQKSKEVG